VEFGRSECVGGVKDFREGSQLEGAGHQVPAPCPGEVHGKTHVDVDVFKGVGQKGLADFLLSFHVPAETGVRVIPFRAAPLTDRAAVLVERLGHHECYPQAAALRAVWARACAAKAWYGPAMMLHGDLHPGNILLADDGSLAEVIDFGDVGAGDPAVDLAAGWLMFDAGARTGDSEHGTPRGVYGVCGPIWSG
jgi:aminoglycoside phosphotransferase (APT) family kinase protein